MDISCNASNVELLTTFLVTITGEYAEMHGETVLTIHVYMYVHTVLVITCITTALVLVVCTQKNVCHAPNWVYVLHRSLYIHWEVVFANRELKLMGRNRKA